MNKPIIIIGAGDHASVLLDILLSQNRNVIALTSVNDTRTDLYNVKIINDETVLQRYEPNTVLLVNGIGSVGSLQLRKKIFDKFKTAGYSFCNVIHSSTIISSRAKIEEGVQILAGAIINNDAVIKENSIINTKVSVDHGCLIGSHVHVAPGCTLSGCVTVGSCSHIGTGTSIIQGIKIGSNVLIGAGSVVIKDIPNDVKAYGNPARLQNN